MREFLHHLFLPHKSNNHRAKILHIDSLILTIALLIFSASLLASVQNTYPSVLGISYDITPNELLKNTNQIREARGLQPLRLDPELSQAAAGKASNMFTNNYWAHIAPDGTTPWVFIKNSGYDYLYAGENLARGFSSASEVVDAWMASPSHRDNMLSPNYKDVGFAVSSGTLTGSDTILVVEMFGSRYNSSNHQVSEIVVAPVVITATPQPQPTQPSPTIITAAASQQTTQTTQVASIQNKPLVDKNDLTKNIVIGILILFIAILLIDAIIIERKKIIRALSHNLDHAIYLSIILFIILIIGRGIVL